MFRVQKNRKFVDIVVPKFVSVGVQGAIEIGVLIMANIRRLGMGPSTTLSIHRDFDPAENVKAFTFTLVRLFRARTVLFSAIV